VTRVLEVAHRLLDQVQGPGDCVAFLRRVFREAGRELPEQAEEGDNATTALYRAARLEGRAFVGAPPKPGDVAFFKETYDRNGDGMRNDGLTHVALVESVDEDGTVSLVHRGSHGAARIWMDLAQPRMRRDERTGKVLNDIMRKDGGARRLTGELFFAYARFLGDPPLYARAVRSQAAP
jgi:hypothetical protein